MGPERLNFEDPCTKTRGERIEFEGSCEVGPSEAQKIRSSGAPIKFSVVLLGVVLLQRGVVCL